MKRSELHEKVWTTPVTKLAKELGISDVGLAKACRRHAIPLPPRGYWAKCKAGQNPPRLPLPAPELDGAVHFATCDPEERARQSAISERRMEMLQAQAASAVAKAPISFAESLEGAHPLVRATQRYCERIPKLIEKSRHGGGLGAWRTEDPQDRLPPEQHGRYNLIHRGCLDINASLESMDWILRFHATLLRGLSDGGMTIVRREDAEDRVPRRSSGPAIEMRFKGEVLTFKFSEGYRRVRLTPSELAERRKKSSWVREFETRPSGNFTFSIQGVEYQASKTWQGNREKLEKLVNDILIMAFQLTFLQPQLKREREAREASARRAEEQQAQERRTREARAEQVKQAFLMMEADARVRQLEHFLDRLEQTATELVAPYDERLRVWIGVVKNELAVRSPVDEVLHKCLTVPSWSTWPPAWWPAATSGGDRDDRAEE